MRRFLAVVLACALPACALADVVGVTGMYADSNIHQITAPNGQALYFTAIEAEPPVVYADVNFDGLEDIVVTVASGAANFYSIFFVQTASGYVRANWDAGDDTGLPNYQLHPDLGLVSTHANNGWAGLLHDDCLFRWEGASLVWVRRSVCDMYHEFTYGEGFYTGTAYNDRVQWRVTERAQDGAETILHEAVLTAEEASQPGVFDEGQEALWEGVR